MVRRVFQIYVDQAAVLMPAAAAVFVVAGILATVLAAAGPATAVLGALIRLVALTLFTGMVVELVADVQDGRRDAGAADLLRAVMPVLGTLIAVAIVAAIVEAIGFLLLIVPGVILFTLWAVAAPVVVIERTPGLGALGRSREIVRGNGWRVFLVLLVLAFLVVIVTGALALAAESASTSAGIVVGVVVGVLTAPLPALASAVLYFALRREQPPATAASAFGSEPPQAL